MEKRLMRVLFIWILVLIAIGLFATFGPVKAHSQYEGKRNPVSGVGCCGGHDCAPVDVNRVEETKDSFIVDNKWVFLKDEAMQSTDGQYHACIWGGKPRCFFVPMNT